VSSSLVLSHKGRPEAHGPFPRLSSMEMPVYEAPATTNLPTNESKLPPSSSTPLTVSLESVSHEKKVVASIESSKVLVLIIYWLHGRVLTNNKKLWVTDRKFNLEIHELNSVMARWTQVGRSFH